MLSWPCKIILLLAALLSVPWMQSHAQTPIASIPISGAEQSSGGTWDSGTVTVTIDGTQFSVSYGQFSTPQSIASALGGVISNDCGFGVTAQASGATLNFYGSIPASEISISSTSNDPTLFASASFAAISCMFAGNSATLFDSVPDTTPFYTLDGSQATEASIEYGGSAVTLTSQTSTVNVIAAQMTNGSDPQGVAVQSGQATVSDWKTVVAATEAQAENYGFTSYYDTPDIADGYCGTQFCDDGTQGIPSAIDFLGSLYFPSAYPSGSSTAANLAFTTENIQGTYPSTEGPPYNAQNGTQVLWPYNTGSSGCYTCTSMVEDFYIWPQNTSSPSVSPSNVEDWEMDLEKWDTTDSEWLGVALQCSDNAGGWEYDYQGGSWALLKDANSHTLTHDCPLPFGTLSAAISSDTQDSFSVTPGTSYSGSPAATVEPGMIVLVDSEEIFCEAASGDTCTMAIRGYGGTTAATHSNGEPWAGSVHVQFHATAAPGNSSATINYLNLNYYPSLDTTNNDNNNVFSNLTVPATSLQSGYPDRVYDQKQVDVPYGVGSTASPVQVGEYTDQDNVTSSYGVLASASCTVP